MMAYEIRMDDDGILRIIGEGEFHEQMAEAVMRDLEPYLQAAEGGRPLLLLSDVRQSGKLSTRARALLAELGQDPRLAKNAVLGVGRYTRVMASFINKASGRDNLRFFETDQEAIAWLSI